MSMMYCLLMLACQEIEGMVVEESGVLVFWPVRCKSIC